MKKTIITLLTGAALFATLSVQATDITGNIKMGGTVTLDGPLLGSANAATAFSSVVVGGTPSQAFANTAGDSVNWNGFSWDPSNTPIMPLWSFLGSVTGWTYSFDLLSVSVVTQNNLFLNLSGTGVLKITGGGGYTDTPGTWSFTITEDVASPHPSFEFTFANSQTASAVPDGGMTLMLLGSALTGLALIRRKI